MRRLRLLATLALALFTALPALFVASCDDAPVDVIQTEYGYSITIDDIHLAEGVYAECLIRLSSGGLREEAVRVNYKIDDDLSLRVKLNGQDLVPGANVTFDISGQIRLQLPPLAEGTHKLHLVITNRYDKSVEKTVTFNVIRDKVPATAVAAPQKLRLQVGSPLDTTVSVVPAGADILALGVVSSDPSVVAASLHGEGAEKVLTLTPLSDGSASVDLFHEDLGPAAAASIAVEVFSYKISGLSDMTLTEGDEASLTLTVDPAAEISLTSSDASCVEVRAGARNAWTLKAVRPGAVTLTAAAGNARAEATVTVVKRDESIALSPMSASIANGATKLFNVVSSAGFTAESSSDAMQVVERSATGVTVKNVSPYFEDMQAQLTVINDADGSKRAVASVLLEKRKETITLAASSSSEGRAVYDVGGENGGWEVTTSPDGVRCSVQGSQIVLVNETYKTVTGRLSVKTKVQGAEAAVEASVPGLTAVAEALSLDPSSFTVEEGQGVSFSVSSRWSDGSSKDVTGEVTWTQSQNLTRSGNSFTALKEGSAWVRASYAGLSATADGTVTAKPVVLESLSIDPSTFNALVDESRLFAAYAALSTGERKDVTRECEWNVMGAGMLQSGGYVKFTGTGEVIVEATYSYGGATKTARARGNVTKPSGTVTGVGITPPSATVMVGGTVSFTGEVRYSDGTKDHSGNFSVTPLDILSGADGSYVAVKEGAAQVMYSYAGYSATAVVTVQSNGGGGGGGETPAPGEVTVASVILNRTSVTMYVGGSSSVTATAMMSDGSARDVTGEAQWTSSNETVALVDAYGRISALKAGTSDIRAVYGGRSAQCAVTVEEEVRLEKVALTPGSLALTVGEGGGSFTAKAYYSDGTSLDVTNLGQWASSDRGVASVDGAGNVSPVGAGSCDVSCAYRGVTGTGRVAVSKPAVTVSSFTMSQTSATLEIGGTLQLSAAIRFSDGTGGTYNSSYGWTSSNPSVATVDGGRVTARSAGTARITASGPSPYQSITCYCDVAVKAAPATLSGLRLGTVSGEVAAGGTFRLPSSATAVYSDGSTKTVTPAWSGSASGVTVSGAVVTVSASAKAGDVTLTASYTEGGRTVQAQFILTVVTQATAGLTSISASPASLSLAIGDTYALPGTLKVTATYSTGATSDVTSAVTWSVSTNTQYAYLNGKTLVAKAVTPAGVTVPLVASYTHNGTTRTTTVSVTVTAKTTPVTKLEILNASPIEMMVGGADVALSLRWNGGQSVPSNTKVTFQSSGPAVATVGSTGVVHAVNAGTCHITATAEEGSGQYTASVEVRVTKPQEVVYVSSISFDQQEYTVEVNKSIQIGFTVSPANATSKTVNPSHDDRSGRIKNLYYYNREFVEVQAGSVTGDVNITVTATDGSNKSARCLLHVVAPSPTGLKVYYGNEDVTGGSVQMATGSENARTFTARFEPEGATGDVTWSSNPSSIASVSGGTVVGLATGTATVTARSGDLSASFSVNVTETVYELRPDSYSLEWTSDEVSEKPVSVSKTNVSAVRVSATNGFSARVGSNDASKAVVYVKPDKSNTGSSDKTGTLTISDADGRAKSVTVSLTQSKPESPYVKEIRLSASSVTVKWGAQDSKAVKAVPYDQYGNPFTGDLEASVSPSGLVTVSGSRSGAEHTFTVKGGDAPGDGTVTLVSYDGKGGAQVKASFSVKVESTGLDAVPVTGVSLDVPATMILGGTATARATVSPDNATNRQVLIESSDASVLKVNGQKAVTVASGSAVTLTAAGSMAGNATVTATAVGKDAAGRTVSETKEVKVIRHATGLSIRNGNTEESSWSAYRNDTREIYVMVEPADAVATGVTCTVDGYAVSVEKGEKNNNTTKFVLAANAAGTATLTFRVDDRDVNVSKTYTVTVQEKQEDRHAFEIVNRDNSRVSGIQAMEVGETVDFTQRFRIKHTVNDSNVSYMDFSDFGSSASLNVDVAGKVVVDGLTVKGAAAGDVNISASLKYSVFNYTTNTITFRVSAAAPDVLTNIGIYNANLDNGQMTLNVGKEETITVKGFNQKGAEMSGVTFSVASDNADIVKVRKNDFGEGWVLRGMSEGTAIVTASSGSVSFAITVVVEDIPTAVVVTPADRTIYIQQSQSLTMTATAQYADGRTKDVTSSERCSWSIKVGSSGQPVAGADHVVNAADYPSGSTVYVSATYNGVTGTTRVYIR